MELSELFAVLCYPGKARIRFRALKQREKLGVDGGTHVNAVGGSRAWHCTERVREREEEKVLEREGNGG